MQTRSTVRLRCIRLFYKQFSHKPIVARVLDIRKMALRAHRRAGRPEPVTPSIHSSPLLHLLYYIDDGLLEKLDKIRIKKLKFIF